MILKGRVFRAKKAQARLTESLLAVGLILITFTTSIYIMSSSRLWTIYEKADLDRLGYNLLSYLLEAGVIDNLNDPGAKEELKFFVERNLPPMTFYNLTVYRCKNGSNGAIDMEVWLSISNVPEQYSSDAFKASVEVSSSSALYTSKKSNIHFLILVLARSEGTFKTSEV